MATFRLPKDVAIHGVVIHKSQELGRGSDAAVYSGAWHGAPVAVKLLHPTLIARGNVGRDSFLEKFGLECERLRSLRHPNIVQFLGVFMDNGVPALVTEKMDMTLQGFYESQKLTTSLELRLLKEAASGLSYIHAQGMLHRDLTTRNVLVTSGWRAKLADVGVSRFIHGPGSAAVAAAASKLTRAPGTLVYMSPEALLPDAVYDEKLDVFSFAVVMTAVVSRKEPSGTLMYAERFAVIDGTRRDIPEVDRRAEDLTRISQQHPLRGLILRCLANDPANRPSTKEVLQALSDVVSPGGEETDCVGGERVGEPSDLAVFYCVER